MGTNPFSIRRLLPAALAAAVAAPMLSAQTPQDTASNKTWRVPTRAPSTATGSTTTPAPTPTPTSTAVPQVGTAGVPDTAFVREVRTDNQLEVRLGQLAAQRATNPAVKQFGQQMVTDHNRMGNEWTSLASRTGIRGTSALDATQQQLVSRLSSLSGAEFDREYMNTMVQDHQLNISTFQRLGPSAQSADVRQLAANGLPILEQHLTMAQQVAGQVGAVATTSTGLPAPAQPGRVATNDNKVGGKGVRADQEFVQEVSQGHAMEVELAQLAQQKAKDGKVKQFAGNVLNDFKDYGNRWDELASNNGMSVPHLGHLHRDKVERLQKASRGQFDRVYIDIVKENLASMVPYFQKEGRQAQSPQVRNLVNKELPTIQQHLNRAQDLDRQVEANAKGSDKDKSASNNK